MTRTTLRRATGDRAAHLTRADSQRVRFIAQALEHAAAVRGSAGCPRIPDDVLEPWGRRLRAQWDALPVSERTVLRCWFEDYTECAINEDHRRDALDALAFLDYLPRQNS